MQTIAVAQTISQRQPAHQQQGCTNLSSANPIGQPGNGAKLQALTDPSAPPALIGSGWDVAPTAPAPPLPHHLAEWIEGSAVNPELAAANLVSLSGAAVIEALTGDRLARLRGHAGQYVTGAVVRASRALESVADGGGWWCSGLDPLADWRTEQGWGTFKPERPRRDPVKEKPLKYENPQGIGTRLIWLKVPAVVAQSVADRFGLALPPDVAADSNGDAGAFWRWWAAERRLPLLVVEGAKKAAALLTAGLPAVAAPGIYNPSAGGVLHPDLAAVPLAGRPCWVLFDHSDKPDPAEPKAARRLGWLLQHAGADVLVGCCPGPHKGADDALAAGVPWETLAAALRPPAPAPALPRLRKADITAVAGVPLGEAIAIPGDRKVIALAAAMGAGKTRLIAQHLAPLQAAGHRVILITHRCALGEATAQDLGLPWADEAAPGSDLRQTGIALCIDSLCPGSRLRINPADWAGAIVVIDEVTAVLAHALMGKGTAINDRRVSVLQTLAELLRLASQVIVADAQLDDATLQAIEQAAGETAYLIGSDHRPAAGRRLVRHSRRETWRGELVSHLKQRLRVWVSTTAAEGESQNSATHLAQLVTDNWPAARVLVVDRDTANDPTHDAHRLAAAPNDIAGRYDVVICTPAIAAGLSVTLRRHFAAVFAVAGGTTDPGAVAQAMGRVRDDCPRHFFAPMRSPGDKLRVGCGSICRDQVMLQLRHHEQAAVSAAAAAGVNLATGAAGPWLPLWAELAAQLNRARRAFRDTVAGLLEREGYRLEDADPEPETLAAGVAAGVQLREMVEAATADHRQRIIDSAVISDADAKRLQDRRRGLSPAERAQLERWRINRAWGLAGAPPSADLIEADNNGDHRRAVFRWAVTDPAAAAPVAAHDRQEAQRLAPAGLAFSPDLTDALLTPRIQAAQALGLHRWLQRSDWFGPDDPQLLQLADNAAKTVAGIIQALGINVYRALRLKPAKRHTTVLRQLLALVGGTLEARRVRLGPGRGSQRAYHYRVRVAALPAGIDPAQVVGAWLETLAAGGVPKSSRQE
jgi:hypothetical protein